MSRVVTAIPRAGDVIVADDDGVVVVPRLHAEAVLKASAEREARENQTRRRLEAGDWGLDIYALRQKLAGKGIRYE